MVMGAVNAVSAVPMARFSSNKMLDMSDLKANGFTFGGAGLTLMSCWMAWWFSGGYPGELRPLGPGFLALWAAVCAGTTLNWEVGRGVGTLRCGFNFCDSSAGVGGGPAALVSSKRRAEPVKNGRECRDVSSPAGVRRSRHDAARRLHLALAADERQALGARVRVRVHEQQDLGALPRRPRGRAGTRDG